MLKWTYRTDCKDSAEVSPEVVQIWSFKVGESVKDEAPTVNIFEKSCFYETMEWISISLRFEHGGEMVPRVRRRRRDVREEDKRIRTVRKVTFRHGSP